MASLLQLSFARDMSDTLRFRTQRSAALIAALLLFGVLWVQDAPPVAAQSGGTDIITALQRGNAYISPHVGAPNVQPGDTQRLNAAARAAAAQGVQEKLAIVKSTPYPDAAIAASQVRHSLGFSGVLVLVSSNSIGVSSDKLSSSELNDIASRAATRCGAQTFTDCAIFAGKAAADRVKADQQSSSRSSNGIWIAVILILLGALAFAVIGGRRRRGAVSGRLDDMRRAAGNTLSQADDAIAAIESDVGSGKRLAPDLRSEYDRALALRNGAQTELERANSPEMLTQANQDAARSVLALQGVMRQAGISGPLTTPFDAPLHRCFYCAHTDRPPYTARSIDDGKGNSMSVEVCSVCEQELARGQQPNVATVNYGGSQVPWFAVPGNPWYYGYGGSTWQYWLPFIVGMDVGSWFGGGWGGGAFGGGDWDNGGWGSGSWDPSGGQGMPDPSDSGGAGFGGWDAGGGGWDSGGGDSGAGDFGGGDFGGGDFGGGGDWS